jgi:hypothetical protein
MSEGSKWQLPNKQNSSVPFKNMVITDDADLASLRTVSSLQRCLIKRSPVVRHI